MCWHGFQPVQDLTSRVSCSSLDSDSWNEETFADDCDTATNGRSEGHVNAPLVNGVTAKGPPKDGECSMTKPQRSKKASPKKPKAEGASDLTWFQAFCLLLEWLKIQSMQWIIYIYIYSSLAGL